MIPFRKLKKLFPESTYQIGILSARNTYALGKVKLKRYYHTDGMLFLVRETEKIWKTIKNSLIVVQFSPVAYDYSIKDQTKHMLRTFKGQCILISLDLKEAALAAGLGSRAYNTLVWSTRFGFDCKITAWGFFEKITGYRKPRLPYWFPTCKTCSLLCHTACPGKALSGTTLSTFKIHAPFCNKIVGKELGIFMSKHPQQVSDWNGVPGGITTICRRCQEQIPCAAPHRK